MYFINQSKYICKQDLFIDALRKQYRGASKKEAPQFLFNNGHSLGLTAAAEENDDYGNDDPPNVVIAEEIAQAVVHKKSSEILMMSEKLCLSVIILCRRIYLCESFFTKKLIFKLYRHTKSIRLKASLHYREESYLLSVSNQLLCLTINRKTDISVKIVYVKLYRRNCIFGLRFL